MKRDDLIVVAQLAGPHGIKGEVKIRSFCDPVEACFAYGPFLDEKGQLIFEVEAVKPYKQGFLACVKPNQSREYWAAQGKRALYVPRASLPHVQDTDDFYQIDLIGLIATCTAGEVLGVVKNVINFGAGDILEILSEKGDKEWVVPFDRESVAEISMGNRTLKISEPDLWLQEASV